MLQKNRMILKRLFKQQAEWKEERTRMLPELDRSQATNRLENVPKSVQNPYDG
jgi:hypothetical protein